MTDRPLRIVLDTSVLVAATRSRRGASAMVLSMVGTTELEIHLSLALTLEYEEVLKRDAHPTSIAPTEVDELIAFLCANAKRCEPLPRAWPLATDPGDEMVARLALTSGCSCLVTHNVRHFTPLAGLGVSVVTPAELLRIMRSGP